VFERANAHSAACSRFLQRHLAQLQHRDRFALPARQALYRLIQRLRVAIGPALSIRRLVGKGYSQIIDLRFGMFTNVCAFARFSDTPL